MTSSIPLSLPESIVPSGTPVVAPGLPPGGVSCLPDFAGLLDAPVTGAIPAAIPATIVALDVPAMSTVPAAPAEDVLPVGTPWVGIPAGVPAMPLSFAGVARRFAPAPGRVERAGEMPDVSENAAVDAAVTPTRAEQEEAMAMLSAFFPALPAATPLQRNELAPALAETGQFAPAAISRLHPTDQTDPADRSDVAIAPATFGAPEAPAQPAVLAGQRDATPPHSVSPRVSWPDAPETAHPQIPLVAAAVPGPLSPVIEPAALGLAGAAAVESPALTKQPAPDCTVVEASVVRPDGVRLARCSVVGSVATPGRALMEEKSAGAVAAKVTPPAGEKNGAGKKVLSASGQRLAENEPDDGTTAANGRANMNLLSPLASDAPAQRPAVVESVSAPSTHEAAVLAAPRVLSTVLEVVEAQEASKLRPVPAVHLRMQVAGEMVGIKVELRDNTVQTHFTTVSPELREVLTREWQAARTGTPEGAPRLLDPVFNSNPDRSGSASQGQDAASQQQQARTWGFPWQQSASPLARRPRPAAAPESTPATVEALDARLFSAVA